MRRLVTVAAVALVTVPTTAGLSASGGASMARGQAVPSVQRQAMPPLPAEVRDRKRWVIGVRCDFPPFGYLNARGEYAGYDVEIAHRFAQIAFGERNRVDFACVNTPNRIPTLLAGKVDIILATLTWTQSRAELVDYSLPYYGAGGRLAVLETSSVSSMGDLSGKTVVTTRGSAYDRWLGTCLKAATPQAVDSVTAAQAALKEGRADAYMFDEAFLLSFLATNPDIRLTQDAFLQLPWGIGIRKGETAMLNWVNAAIQRMTRNDEFFKLLRSNVPPVAVGDVPRPGRPALKYPVDRDPLTDCTVITLPPRETPAARPTTPNARGTATASIRPLRRCPVCGFEATFVFTQLPAKGSTVTATWFYNRQKLADLPKKPTRRITSFIKWAGPAPRGYHWCELTVKPPGKRAATVARAVIRRR